MRFAAKDARWFTGVRGGTLRRCLRRLRGERGAFTVIELLISVPLMASAMIAAALLNVAAVNDQDRVQSRVGAELRKEGIMAKMTRELRQATEITYPPPGSAPGSYSQIRFKAQIKPPPDADGIEQPVGVRDIEYACPIFQFCLRREKAEQEAWSPSQYVSLIDMTPAGKPIRFKVTNPDVFTLAEETTDCPGAPAPSSCFETKPRSIDIKLEVEYATENCRFDVHGDPAKCPRAPRSGKTATLEDGVELINTRPLPDADAGGGGLCEGANQPDECW